MDDDLFTAVEDEHDGLEQSSAGVEAEAEFSGGSLLLGEGLDPDGSLGSLDGVVGGDPVLERAGVDLHAAKCASAARIASERLIWFFDAAASSASNSSAVSRTATTCIGSAPRPGRPRPRRLSASTS